MNKYGHWESKEIKLDTYNAFVYKVTLNIEGVDKFYIGYKTTKGNWMEYKTSSRKVKKLWDCVVKAEILEWFDEGQKALEREIELLTEVSAHTNDSYLNMHIGGVKFNSIGSKLSDNHKKQIGKAAKIYADKNKTEIIERLNKFRHLSIEATKNSPAIKEYIKSDMNKDHLNKIRILSIEATRNSELVKQHNNSEKNIQHLKNMANCPKRIDASKKSEKSKKQRIEVQKIMVEKRKRKCTDGINIFNSVSEAAAFHSISRLTISNRLRKGLFGWKYI